MKTLFVGDICPTKYTESAFAAADMKTLFNDTLSIFENRDFVFANLECAITESENRIKKFGPNLKAPRNTAKVLKNIGVTVTGLSNNHVFDFGKEGALDTIRALSCEALDYTGFGDNYADSKKNYVFEKNDERICIIAVCEHEYSYALEDRMGSRPFDEFETLEDIRAAKTEYDRVIVIYHGGKEQCHYPSPRLVRACRAMARAGADLILGQHSHCIGTYELYEGAHILYGQGNFNFVNTCKHDNWNTGLAVAYDTKSGEIEFIPVKQNDEMTGICLVKDDERTALLKKFKALADSMQNGVWKDGWHEFCLSVAEGYLNNISRACREDSTERENAIFAHNLDCEAHHDVITELFPTYNATNEK